MKIWTFSIPQYHTMMPEVLHNVEVPDHQWMIPMILENHPMIAWVPTPSLNQSNNSRLLICHIWHLNQIFSLSLQSAFLRLNIHQGMLEYRLHLPQVLLWEFQLHLHQVLQWLQAEMVRQFFVKSDFSTQKKIPWKWFHVEIIFIYVWNHFHDFFCQFTIKTFYVFCSSFG